MIQKPWGSAGYVDNDEDEDASDGIEDDLCSAEYENLNDGYDSDENDQMEISTEIGTLHLKTAEAIYFNGGRITFGAKARQSRFYHNSFFEKSPMDIYNNDKKCCNNPGIVNIGDFGKFSTFDQKTVKSAKGQLRFLSKNCTPMKFYCPDHHSAVKVNGWVWNEKKSRYIRCVL